MKSLAITVLVTFVLLIAGAITVYKTPAPEDDGTKYVLRISPDGTSSSADANEPVAAGSPTFDASPSQTTQQSADASNSGTDADGADDAGAEGKTPGRLLSDNPREPQDFADGPTNIPPFARNRDSIESSPFGRLSSAEPLTPAESAIRQNDVPGTFATPGFTPFGGRIMPPSPWNMDVAPQEAQGPPGVAEADPGQDNADTQQAATEPAGTNEPEPSQSAALTTTDNASAGRSSAGEPDTPGASQGGGTSNPAGWAAVAIPPPVKAPPSPDQAAAAKLPPPPVPKKRAGAQPPVPRGNSSSSDLVTPAPVQTAVAEQRNAALITSSITDAVASPSLASGPRISIIVRDLGMDERGTITAINTLSPAITLGFSPYGRDVRAWAQKAAQKGHDLFAGVPMEPASASEEAPPNMLLASLTPEENQQRLDWALGQFENPAGVINIMGGKLSQTPEAIRPFMQSVKDRGLTYVDDGAAAHPFAILLAAQLQVPYRIADSRIDDDPSEAAIQRELSRLEDIARTKGTAIGVARADPETIRQLVLWSGTLEKRKISLVQASQIVKPVNLP